MATGSYILEFIERPYLQLPMYFDLTGGTDGTTIYLGYDSTFHEIGQEMGFYRTLAPFVTIGFRASSDQSLIYRNIKFRDYTGLEPEYEDGTSVAILQIAIADKMATYEKNIDSVDATDSGNKANFYQTSSLVNQNITFTKL